MFKRPMILGVGSLGSILCEKIVEKGSFDKLSILDYDIVKNRNLRNSIFTEQDIGKKKTDVIQDKFSDKIMIDSFDFKFIESFNDFLFDCDVIIDCRDFLYDRKNIDVRLFVCNKSLIIDCRKSVHYENTYEGSYFWSIDKTELNVVLKSFVNLLQSNQIKNMIKNNEINEINANGVNNFPICTSVDKDEDIIIDKTNKISNPEIITRVDVNKKANVKLYSNTSNVKTKEMYFESNNNSDIIIELESLLPKFDNNNYLMIVSKNEISIIPETGAA